MYSIQTQRITVSYVDNAIPSYIALRYVSVYGSLLSFFNHASKIVVKAQNNVKFEMIILNIFFILEDYSMNGIGNDFIEKVLHGNSGEL